MPMAQVKMILCHVLFASIESRLISQQFSLEDCAPKLLHHTSACVSAILRKEVYGTIFKKNLLKMTIFDLLL